MGKNNPDAPGGPRVPINQPIKIYRNTDPERSPLKQRKKRATTLNELRAKLVPLIRRLKRAQKVARRLGLFADDRELLTCPRCGLAEDVDINGMILSTAPGDRRCDTGLRFERVTKRGAWWRCPNCKTVLKEPVAEAMVERKANSTKAARRRLAGLGGSEPRMKAPRRRRA